MQMASKNDRYLPASFTTKEGDLNGIFLHSKMIKMEERPSKQKKTTLVDRSRFFTRRFYSSKIRSPNLYAAPPRKVDDFVAPVFPKSEHGVKFLRKVFSENFMLSGLTTDEEILLINYMQRYRFYSNEIIINQGDEGDFFYVLKSGKVQFLVDNKLVGEGSDGCSFGELALLHNAPRSATVIALTDCYTYRLDQCTFRSVLAKTNAISRKKRFELLKRIAIFKNTDAKVLANIADAMTQIVICKGNSIIRNDEVEKALCIIQEGEVKITYIRHSKNDLETEPDFFKSGDFFGECALLTGEKIPMNVTAIKDCTLLYITKATLDAVASPLDHIISDPCKERMLMRDSVFASANLRPDECKLLCNMLTKVDFCRGSTLIEKAKPVFNIKKGLYFVRKGEITIISSNGDMSKLTAGDSFGNELVNIDHNLSPTCSARVTEDISCYLLSIEDIKLVLGGLDRLRKKSFEKCSCLDNSVTLKTIHKVKIIGTGTYGQVWLATDKKRKKTYALKILDKHEVIERSQEKNVVREKNLMTSLNHPFVIKIINSFQDKHSLFMVMEFIQGGELFSVIHSSTKNGIPENSARFYAANIYDGLMHLHKRKILYRDLKPANVLIGIDGYCVITDLGFSKVVNDKTYTFCGTPLYIAPEIILSRGYGKAVDNWSFGIILFEMIIGHTPFYSSKEDQKALFRSIVKGDYRFPRRCKASVETKDLISKLLVPNPSKRLGSLAGGDKDIRQHPWLASLTQSQMLSKTVAAPWKPKITSCMDSHYFDSFQPFKSHHPLNLPPLTKSQQTLFAKF